MSHRILCSLLASVLVFVLVPPATAQTATSQPATPPTATPQTATPTDASPAPRAFVPPFSLWRPRLAVFVGLGATVLSMVGLALLGEEPALRHQAPLMAVASAGMASTFVGVIWLSFAREHNRLTAQGGLRLMF